MKIEIQPIGYLLTKAEKIPRHWTVSDAEGIIRLEKTFLKAAKDIEAGQKIIVIFLFDRSRKFTRNDLVQSPRHKNREMGVFSICSPVRPNPIGMSVVDVLAVKENDIYVKRIDMLNETPVIDIKPFVRDRHELPSGSDIDKE